MAEAGHHVRIHAKEELDELQHTAAGAVRSVHHTQLHNGLRNPLHTVL